MFWPIPREYRVGVVNQMLRALHVAESDNHSIAACRNLVTASRLNLKHRQLPHPEVPRMRPPPPLPTRKEYAAYVETLQEYLDYRHDYKLLQAGYPEGCELRYLEFKVIPCVTPQSIPDRSRRYKGCEYPEPPAGEPWETADLYPIPLEHREFLVNRLMRHVMNKEKLSVSISASRVMLSLSAVNLMYQKAGDIKPPPKPWPEWEPEARDYHTVLRHDPQYMLYSSDRMMHDDGYPRGETFRWKLARDTMRDELIDWPDLNAALDFCDVVLPEDPPEEPTEESTARAA